MDVRDLPLESNQAQYDEAVTRYAELVRSRAIAVYRIGQIRYPGLSDARLLVVTDRAGIGNRYFFSAQQRLPRRFHALFLREPFVLPAWSLRVMQHTVHRPSGLLAGRDVLHSYALNEGRDERWCRLLEARSFYSAFIANAQQSHSLEARATMVAAAAMRHALEDAGTVLRPCQADGYAVRIDALRDGFFARKDPENAVLEAWNAMREAFEQLDSSLESQLGVHGPAAESKLRALLAGEEECAAFDREYAFRRARDIDGYHQELASLGFPYGHLFDVTAHPGAIRTVPDAPVVAPLVRNYYRMRRRMSEYAS